MKCEHDNFILNSAQPHNHCSQWKGKFDVFNTSNGIWMDKKFTFIHSSRLISFFLFNSMPFTYTHASHCKMYNSIHMEREREREKVNRKLSWDDHKEKAVYTYIFLLSSLSNRMQILSCVRSVRNDDCCEHQLRFLYAAIFSLDFKIYLMSLSHICERHRFIMPRRLLISKWVKLNFLMCITLVN